VVESTSKSPVAIVTGAGGGIGTAICIELAKAGYHISLVGRSETSLQATVNEIAVSASNVAQTLVVPADLSDHHQFTNIVQRTYQHWGKIDVLINNAAACPNFPIDQTTIQELQGAFATNYFAPALLVAELWPIFIQQGFGCVINITSHELQSNPILYSRYGTSPAIRRSCPGVPHSLFSTLISNPIAYNHGLKEQETIQSAKDRKPQSAA